MIKAAFKRLPLPLQNLARKLINIKRRHNIAMAYYRPHLAMIRRWMWRDKELSNFYYRITPENRDHLAHMVATVTGASHDVITGYFSELEDDDELREHLEGSLKQAAYGKAIEIHYGRRIGWYAFTRILKPCVVIETGIDHGVGSCVLASAILRNRAEGFEGNYYGTEIRPEAGQLFRGKYAEAGKILYGDSIESLQAFNGQIDLFVNDSDHSGEYEYHEYQTILNKLSPAGVILGDNAHATDALSRFSLEHNRQFLFFSEKPAQHWYPGAGIGISYLKR